MKLHELKRSKGFKDKARRLGRGDATKGNYSGKGHKGQKARNRKNIKPFFEGGQTSLVQRMPKAKGFKRHYKLIDVYAVINVSALEKDTRISGEVTKASLKARWSKLGTGTRKSPVCISCSSTLALNINSISSNVSMRGLRENLLILTSVL